MDHCAKPPERDVFAPEKLRSDPLTERIIGAAIEVHRTLGPGLLEAIYKDALCHEFGLRDIPFARQVELPVVYKGHTIRGQRVDLLVDDAVIVKLKSATSLADYATAQVLSYLKTTGLKRALLINFGAGRLIDGVKRFVL